MALAKLQRSPTPGGEPPPCSSKLTPTSASAADSHTVHLIERPSPNRDDAKNGTAKTVNDEMKEAREASVVINPAA